MACQLFGDINPVPRFAARLPEFITGQAVARPVGANSVSDINSARIRDNES